MHLLRHSRDELQPRLASAYMPLARLLSPTALGQSLVPAFPRQTLLYARIFCRAPEKAVERQAARDLCSATRCCHRSFFGTMPHVAAYGILLVQALFFFLGG